MEVEEGVKCFINRSYSSKDQDSRFDKGTYIPLLQTTQTEMVNITNISTAKHQYVRWHIYFGVWCDFLLACCETFMIKDVCDSYGGHDIKNQPYEHELNESDMEVFKNSPAGRADYFLQ